MLSEACPRTTKEMQLAHLRLNAAFTAWSPLKVEGCFLEPRKVFELAVLIQYLLPNESVASSQKSNVSQS
jgi:hypothetical protein